LIGAADWVWFWLSTQIRWGARTQRVFLVGAVDWVWGALLGLVLVFNAKTRGREDAKEFSWLGLGIGSV